MNAAIAALIKRARAGELTPREATYLELLLRYVAELTAPGAWEDGAAWVAVGRLHATLTILLELPDDATASC